MEGCVRTQATAPTHTFVAAQQPPHARTARIRLYRTCFFERRLGAVEEL